MNRFIILFALYCVSIGYAATYTQDVANIATTASIVSVIDNEIDAYSNDSTEVNLIWTALMYQSLGPSEKVDYITRAVNPGYTVADGTAVIALDTYEVLDNGVRTTINTTAEVFGLAALTDLYNTSEVYLMLSYDSAFVYTLGTSTEIGVASAEVQAVPAGDSPILLLYVQNDTCEVFEWGTDNWNKDGVTTTVYQINWPNSGASAYSQ